MSTKNTSDINRIKTGLFKSNLKAPHYIKISIKMVQLVSHFINF